MIGSTNRCNYCGMDVPIPEQTDPETGKSLNLPLLNRGAEADSYGGWNKTAIAEVCADYSIGEGIMAIVSDARFTRAAVKSWCETCVFIDGEADELTFMDLMAMNGRSMGAFDWVALIFAVFVVALAVVGELKDIELCSMAVAHAGDKLSKGWRLALGFLLGMRRWVFLPALVVSVPFLVLYKGGDALSVCLNTVAILFLCDIDNIFFDLVLGERVRARVEDAGRVELEDAEASALARTKAVHVALIVLSVCSLMLVGEPGAFLPLLAFLLGGVAEALVLGASAAETAKRVGKVLGAWLLACFGFIFLVILSVLL